MDIVHAHVPSGGYVHLIFKYGGTSIKDTET